MAETITKRQKDLLGVIYRYIQDTGYPPTFEEMRLNLGVVSNQSVIDHLKGLEREKVIRRESSTARSIAILPLGYEILGRPALVPFLGITSAGFPLEAVEIPGDWLPVSADVARLKDEVFLLKISGDSMINAGINDGDVVLVKADKEFASGDIVLAQTAGESTVKRFISEDKPPYVYLKPENPKYGVVQFTDETELKGKVIATFRNGYWKPLK